MSMLSAQCDELRSMAESVGLEVPQAATLMMEAADTIWELRCKCAGMVDMRERARLAEVENARLRKELEQWHRLTAGIELPEYPITEFKPKDLERENAKLRELVAGIGHLLFVLDVDYCAICPRDDINHPCPVHTVKGGECLYEADLRELGVEAL